MAYPTQNGGGREYLSQVQRKVTPHSFWFYTKGAGQAEEPHWVLYLYHCCLPPPPLIPPPLTLDKGSIAQGRGVFNLSQAVRCPPMVHEWHKLTVTMKPHCRQLE